MVKRISVLAGLLSVLMGLQSASAQSPPAPTNLVAVLVKTFPPSVGLAWNALRPTSTQSFFKMYRSLEDSVHFNLLGVTKDTLYNDKAALLGHTYYYRVTMVVVTNDTTVQESDPSNIASVVVVPPPGIPHGLIIGTVKDSVTGHPLNHILMMFFRRSSPLPWIEQTWTDSLGNYRAVLDTGLYLILAQPLRWPLAATIIPFLGYRQQWYDHVYNPKDATPVMADSPASVANFDLVKILPPPVASLRGVVADTAGKPLANAFVAVLRTPQELAVTNATLGVADLDANEDCDVEDFGHVRGVVWRGWTDSLGRYTAAIPAGRSYFALAIKREYLPQFYDHKSSILEATVIRIPLTTKDTSGFDFNLQVRQILLNSISGVVQDSNGVRVPSHILLFPVPRQPWGAKIRFGSTDLLGAYTIRFVPTGKYFVMAIPYTKYAPAFYKAGAFGILRWKDADTVFVMNAVTGIDIGVVPIHCRGVATLAGTVRSAGNPLEGATVLATDEKGEVVGYGMTGEDGSYTIDAVSVGQITVSVDREGYQPAQTGLSVGVMDFSVNQDFDLAVVTAVGVETVVPVTYALDQNYPNPFNPTTEIKYQVPTLSWVTLKVYDVLGREVATLVDESKAAGAYSVRFAANGGNGAGFASGVYFYRLQANDLKSGSKFASTMKMLLLK